MSKMRIDSFAEAEASLRTAALELKRIKEFSDLLDGSREQAGELVNACQSLVGACEVLRQKAADAMDQIAAVDLRGSLTQMGEDLRTMSTTLEREVRSITDHQRQHERDLREISKTSEQLRNKFDAIDDKVNFLKKMTIIFMIAFPVIIVLAAAIIIFRIK